jgi:hypothetical protein
LIGAANKRSGTKADAGLLKLIARAHELQEIFTRGGRPISEMAPPPKTLDFCDGRSFQEPQPADGEFWPISDIASCERCRIGAESQGYAYLTSASAYTRSRSPPRPRYLVKDAFIPHCKSHRKPEAAVSL